MRETTVGQALVNSVLPEDLRDYNRTWDKKTMNKVMLDLTKRYPDQVKDVVSQLTKIGYRGGYLTGGQTFSLDNMAPLPISKKMQVELNKEVQTILANAYKRGLSSTDPKVSKAIIDATAKWSPVIDKALEKEDVDSNGLYRQQIGTQAAKPGTYRSIRVGDLLYVDQNNKPVPMPITRSYSQGLTPAQYFAASFGARKGSVDLQNATQDAGFLCLSEGTLVRMADFSVKPIEEIQTGDWVLGMRDNRCGYPVQVTHTFNNGIKDCYRTTFRLGAERLSRIHLESTLEHKLYGELRVSAELYKIKKDGSKFRTHEQLYTTGEFPIGIDGNFGALPLNSVYDFGGIDEPYALLIGLLIGDGTITNTKNCRDITLSCFDSLLIQYLKESDYLASIGLKMTTHSVKKGQYDIRDAVRASKSTRTIENKKNIALTSELKIKLSNLGLLGTNSYTKSIPKEAYSWNKRSIAALIGGYFITDGSIFINKSSNRAQPMISFGSASKILLTQIKELLEVRFGILCHGISATDYNKRKNPANATAYSITISRRQDVRKFIEEIPVYGIKKNKVQMLETKFSDSGRDKRKYYRIQQEYLGSRNTYDIEVNSDNHLFVLANGLVVSNSKQLVQIAHRLVCVGDDDDDPEHAATNSQIGYPTTVNDPDNEGSFLAMPAAGYPRNTLLTPKVLEDIKRKGIDKIVTRSVIAGGPGNGGIYGYDAGIRERGVIPTQGDFVGINAVQGLSEPLTQGAISSKHSGGVAGASSGAAISGFDYINQLVQVPKHYQGGATHSNCDGLVSNIIDAPQGGKYICVGDEKHYVKAENCDDIKVKVGDSVEAGDVMTGGIPNPSVIVKYKGIGEGRKYFVDIYKDAMDKAGLGYNRRNVEALSRGLINYVRCNDEIGDYAPDDIVPYCMIANQWQPRKDSLENSPNRCKGQYLDKPVLHYTIGTRVTPSVIKTLQDYKIPKITTNKEPPPFQPEMIRGMGHIAEDPDWGTRLLGAYNKESLLEGARRGSVSNTEGTSYVPAIAFNDVNQFGETGATKQLPLDEFAKKEGLND